jgi:8-oxo-dGTP pyrophosphatase MutT (NUDIX family)
MYITPEMIQETENTFGIPHELQFSFLMKSQYEFNIVDRTRLKNRVHDVTIYAFRGDELAVIKKHVYPEGVYRAPSGGVHPGETIEQGALREMKEETGLDVKIEKYLIRSKVDFHWQSEVIHWTTHVFQARPLHFDIYPLDLREILEARFMNLSEINTTVQKKLIETGTTGLFYRALLHEAVMKTLQMN